MKRTLSLKRETLAALTDAELTTLAGAASLPNCIALGSLAALAVCVVLRESLLPCSGDCGTGYNCTPHSYDSDCSCRI